MSVSTPRAWLCKHCSERGDPTMELCWNCGHNRDGDYDPAWYREVGAGAMEACPGCGYSLIGSTDGEQCPECGDALPLSGFKPVDLEYVKGSMLLRVLRGPIGWALAILIALLVLLEVL